MTLPDNEIRDIMQGVIDLFLIPKFVSLGMNATGKWLSNLQADAVNGTGYIKGMNYTEFLAYGRAGGTPPPIQPLITWVGAKFGLYGQEGISAAYAIQKKIAKEGTDYYPQGTDLLEVLESNEVTNYVNERVGAFLRASLTVEIRRMAWQTLS